MVYCFICLFKSSLILIIPAMRVQGPIKFLKYPSLTMLSLASHHEGVWRGIAPSIFTLAQNGVEWSAAHLDHLISGERTLGTY